MSDTPIRPNFLAKAGERELEIFLLRDAARRTFQLMQDRHARELAAKEREQLDRRDADIRQAKVDLLAERAKPELVPKGVPPRKPMKEAELHAAAEHRVDSRNAAEIKTLLHQHREREDAFLSQQKEERLMRESAQTENRQRAALPELKRDFDRER